MGEPLLWVTDGGVQVDWVRWLTGYWDERGKGIVHYDLGGVEIE